MKRLVPLKVLTALLFIDLTKPEWTLYGSSQSFKCTKESSLISGIHWLDGFSNSLFNCDINDSPPCSSYTIAYNDYYTADMTSISFKYTSIFTIKSVTVLQHNTSWQCDVIYSIGQPTKVYFSLNVFAPASTPTCDNVTLIGEKNISIHCFTERIFPDAICRFYFYTNNTKDVELTTGFTEYKTVPSNDGYKRVDCTYTITAEILKLGHNAFNLVIYPNITPYIQNISRESNWTVPIVINKPQAALGLDCLFKGYIKENETRTCTCFNNNTSFLPTNTIWSGVGSKNGTLHFTALRPSINNQTVFKCEIFNLLNFSDAIQYTIIVAYPPDIIGFKIANEVLDQCKKENVTILGYCNVSKGYPEPTTLHIYINNTSFVSNDLVNSNQYTFNISFNSSGNFNVSCYAYNDAFSNPSTIMSQTVIIKGPPDTPKIVHLLNGTQISSSGYRLIVTKGEAKIMCISTGGYPTLKNLSLVCLNEESNATNKETVTLTLNITSSMTLEKITCACTVFHESKCNLQNKSTVQLIFPPDVVNFTLLQPEIDKCDSNKVHTLGYCSVSKTYPEPTVSIFINNTLFESKTEVNTSDYSFNISITSTGIFNVSCLANSSEFWNSASILSKYVIVKGPPETPKIMRLDDGNNIFPLNNILPVKIGETTIMCSSTGGYPLQKNLILVCKDKERNVTNQETVTIKLNITSSMSLDTITCTCTVFHESACQLEKNSTVQLKVSDLIQEPEGTEFKSIYIGVGVAVGIAVSIVVTLILSKLGHGKLESNTWFLLDKQVDNTELYFIMQENSTIDLSIYPEYTNVITTMASAVEAPKNVKMKEC